MSESLSSHMLSSMPPNVLTRMTNYFFQIHPFLNNMVFATQTNLTRDSKLLFGTGKITINVSRARTAADILFTVRGKTFVSGTLPCMVESIPV